MQFTDQDISVWERGDLGASEEHVRVSSTDQELVLDDALGMQHISIRLQKKLIADLKRVAGHHGIGYQPMVRDLLNRFVQAELKVILQEELRNLELQEQESRAESTAPVNQFMEHRRQA